MDIRLAQKDDLPKLKPLVVWACEELERNFSMPRADNLVFGMVEYGVNSGDAVVIAVDEYGDFVGWCARVHHPTMPEGHAEGFGTWVHPHLREERIGSDMRKLADKHAKSRGAKFVNGIAAKDNVAGVKSCLNEGYEIVGYLMRKKLA